MLNLKEAYHVGKEMYSIHNAAFKKNNQTSSIPGIVIMSYNNNQIHHARLTKVGHGFLSIRDNRRKGYASESKYMFKSCMIHWSYIGHHFFFYHSMLDLTTQTTSAPVSETTSIFIFIEIFTF